MIVDTNKMRQARKALLQATVRQRFAPATLDDAVIEPSRSLKCPKCGSEMVRVSFQGVEIDRCTNCGGLWFDVLEHEELRKLGNTESVDKGNVAVEQALDQRQSAYPCPRCGTPLTRITDPHQPHIHLDKCSRDYGVFFEAGEFSDWKTITLEERLRDWFGR
jgi:Zn-finger nucleic acid-binding protein